MACRVHEASSVSDLGVLRLREKLAAELPWIEGFRDAKFRPREHPILDQGGQEYRLWDVNKAHTHLRVAGRSCPLCRGSKYAGA